jgi:hypothetical protein
MEILIMRLGQMLAPGPRLAKRRRNRRDAVAGGQRGPALLAKTYIPFGSLMNNGAHNIYGNASALAELGKIAVLIPLPWLLRSSNWAKA